MKISDKLEKFNSKIIQYEQFTFNYLVFWCFFTRDGAKYVRALVYKKKKYAQMFFVHRAYAIKKNRSYNTTTNKWNQQHDKSNVKFKIGCVFACVHMLLFHFFFHYVTSAKIIFHDFIIALVQMPKANSYNAFHCIVILCRFVAFFSAMLVGVFFFYFVDPVSIYILNQKKSLVAACTKTF